MVKHYRRRSAPWSSRSSAPAPRVTPTVAHHPQRVGFDDCWLMIVAVSALAGLCIGPNGEPGELDGLSDVPRAEFLTLTSSGAVRWAHWRARRHVVRAGLYRVVEP